MQMKITLPELELYKIDHAFENSSHAHDNQFQITVPIQGTCYFNHENKEIALNAGDGLFLNPMDQHSFHTGEDTSLIIIRVSGKGMYPGKRNGEWALRQQLSSTEMLAYFRKWATSILSLERMDDLAVEETQEQALTELHHLLRGDCSCTSAEDLRKPSSPEISDHYGVRVLDYIHSNYTEQMDVDTLAAIALQSRFHFIRSFKSMTGVTPYQYVLQLRVEEAKERLKRSSMTVTDISFSLGFSSPSQFYRIFMKSTGLTPESYRGITHN